MSRHTIRRRVAVLVAAGALLLAVLAAAPPAQAATTQAQAQAPTIYACVKTKSGSARIVTRRAKCKKGEKKLSWSTQGQAGQNGANGAPGPAGAMGATGKEGPTGPRGPGIVALGQSEEENCTLVSGENYCYRSGFEFTPSANAKCLVSVDTQIFGLSSGTPTSEGPYFRIAISTGGSNANDGEEGYYFEGTDGGRSTAMERTKLISVKGGTTYKLGAFYGGAAGEWVGKEANFEVTYTCFG